MHPCVAADRRLRERRAASTGALRVGINYGNVVLAKKDAVTGELAGVHVDLARELARRLDVP